MAKRDKSYSYLATRVADIEGTKPGAVTAKQMAHYFLSNGVDFKGQTQTGYTAKGGGLGVEVEIDAGKIVGMTASVKIDGSVDRLKQSIIFVTRGPDELGGVPISTPIVLSSLMGSKWKGSLGGEFKLGLGAEVGAGVNSGGGYSEAKQDFVDTGEEEDEEAPALFDPDGIESVGVKASCFVGLTLTANSKVEHFFGIDPNPSYYANNQREQLTNELGAWLTNETRKRLLKTQTTTLLNKMRGFVKSRSGNNETLRQNVRDSLGLQRLGWFQKGDFQATDSGFYLVENLKRLIAGLDRGTYTQGIFEGGKHGYAVDATLLEAKNLLRDLAPLYEKAAYAGSWLKIWSVAGGVGGKLGAEAEAEVHASCVVGAKLTGEVNLAQGSWSKRRTNIVWQVEHGMDPKTAASLFCTQDTAIHYTSADAAALTIAVDAEAHVLTKKFHKNVVDKKVVEKGYNSMTYQSGILYWKRPANALQGVEVLEGSGIAFGQSVVISNLLRICEKLKARSPQPVNTKSPPPTNGPIRLSTNPQPMKFGSLKGPIAVDTTFLDKKKPVEDWTTGWKSPKPTASDATDRWVKRVAKSLRVTVDELTSFLTNELVVDVLTDLEQSAQTYTKPTKGLDQQAMDNWSDLFKGTTQKTGQPKDEPWGDRGVLLESSFSFSGNVPNLQYGDEKFVKGVRNELQAARSHKLQAIRLRFRLSDCFASEKTFRLGFKMMGTGVGVSFKKLEEAGTEGIITLCCQYFPPSRNGQSDARDEVPPVTLFSQ